MPSRPSVLYVTDLTYPARGRRYGDEDTALTARLREDFDLALCHPVDAAALMDPFDVVVVRNSGPVLAYRAEYEAFRERCRARRTRLYNPLTGRADMAGKGYLVELGRAGFPVIPTVDRTADLDRLPTAAAYVVKPRLGSDSIGLMVLAPDQVRAADLGDVLIQPKIDFRYEVSFYFVDDVFQYALYAPRPDRRWDLVPYRPDPADLAFARRFIAWNDIRHGVQRVDACRTGDGDLLLVELEDLNPYLSLDLVDEATRDRFVAALKDSIRGLLATPS